MDAARVVVWHNPRCSNSRAVLQLLRDRGIEPDVVDYLAEPPDRAALLRVAGESGLGLRGLVREKDPAYAEQGLADADDEALLAAMLDNPRLINRPVVVTPRGTRLCRPPETVLPKYLSAESPFMDTSGILSI